MSDVDFENVFKMQCSVDVHVFCVFGCCLKHVGQKFGQRLTCKGLEKGVSDQAPPTFLDFLP